MFSLVSVIQLLVLVPGWNLCKTRLTGLSVRVIIARRQSGLNCAVRFRFIVARVSFFADGFRALDWRHKDCKWDSTGGTFRFTGVHLFDGFCFKIATYLFRGKYISADPPIPCWEDGGQTLPIPDNTDTNCLNHYHRFIFHYLTRLRGRGLQWLISSNQVDCLTTPPPEFVFLRFCVTNTPSNWNRPFDWYYIKPSCTYTVFGRMPWSKVMRPVLEWTE